MSTLRAATPEAALVDLAAASGQGSPFMHVLVADRCNHACQHCYQVHGLKGELSFQDIVELLRQFRDGGGFVVSISGGEATLRPDLVDILDRARDLGLASVLFTNAYLVDERLATRLAHAGVWRVEVSVYSDLASEHDAVTRVPGSWAKTIAGIGYLRAAGVTVRVKHTPTIESSATAERLTALAEQLRCELIAGDHVMAGEGASLDPIAARQVPAVLAASHPRANVPVPLEAGPCGIGSGITVRSDGVVTPCTNVAVELGRVGPDTDIQEITRTSETASFFRSLTWGHIHGCRDCDLRGLCSRCFASAGTEAGDMLAPYRGACDAAVAHHARLVGRREILIPDPGCERRDPLLGPFRTGSDGALRPIADVVGPDDEALVERFPWIRPTRAMLEAASQRLGGEGAGSELVQLRRPAPRAAAPHVRDM